MRASWTICIALAVTAGCVGDDPLLDDAPDAAVPIVDATASVEAGPPPDAAVEASSPMDASTDAPDATVMPFRAFVTAQNDFDGSPGAGGRAGADGVCTGAASVLVGSRKWMAYLGVTGGASPEHPATRFSDATNGWMLADGKTPVVADKAALLRGEVLRRLDMTERGTTVVAGDSALVWTGMSLNVAAGTNCANWTRQTGESGRVGSLRELGLGWQSTGTESCSTKQRLYCFEQPL
jgi:hypothetical protein